MLQRAPGCQVRMGWNCRRFARTTFACVSLTAWFALSVSASYASGDGPGWHHGAPFAYEEGLLNYLKFPRATLHEKGIDVHLSTLGIWQSIVAGGTARRSKFSGSYDLQV